MQFNSYSYIVLLTIAVTLFWAIPARMRRWYVLALSVLFYMSWSPAFVLVPIALCAGVFFGSIRIAAGSTNSRQWFWAGIVYALFFLVFFRFQPVWTAPILDILETFGREPGKALFQLAVPLGISFYSFEVISYLIDVRQGRVKPSRFSDLFLFVMFWPHLIAGPIVRFRELVPQFEFKKHFEVEMLIGGLDRLVLGLVQKNLFADPLARWVDEGFAGKVAANTTIDNWFLAIAFGLQIYFDFSAYSNMAIGAARLIGIQLPENFRFPYHAKNPVDFWQRWHMTLSRWIRDYLFFPINVRFQGAILPLYLSLIGVMALVGLWHGAGWAFVLWGVLHGLYLVAYRAWESAQKARWPKLSDSRVVAMAWQLGTLIAVMAAWVPFRAESGEHAISMLRSMFFTIQPRITFPVNFYLVVVLIGLYAAAEPYLAGGMTALERSMAGQRYLAVARVLAFKPLVYAAGLLMFIIFDERDVQFIYFQF